MTNLKEIQNVQLNILKECTDICDRHRLTYFLAQGTLLGAVRHGGFIPWDDDIDIIMPIDDLKKFSEYFAAEAPKDLFLENYYTESQYPYPWTKIRKNNTTSMPSAYMDMPVHWGICIDIFPYYPLGKSRLEKFFCTMCFKISKKMLGTFMTPYEKNASIINRMISAIPGSLRIKIADISLRLMNKQNIDSEYVFALCKGGKVLKREWLTGGQEQKLMFENELFRVPSDYDAYLTEMFGDYMTLPPQSEQIGHDLKLGEIIWDCEKDYTEYKNRALR